MTSGSSFVYRKKNNLKVSDFMARQMLYCHLACKLDEAHQTALLEFLESTPEAQTDLGNMRKAMEYAQELSSIQMSNPAFDRLQVPTPYFHRIYEYFKLDSWPLGVRVGLKVFLIALAVVLIALFTPWYKLANLHLLKETEVILTEIKNYH